MIVVVTCGWKMLGSCGVLWGGEIVLGCGASVKFL